MDISSIGSSAGVTDVLALRQANTVQTAGMTLFKKELDLQKQLAAQLFQAMGIGGNVDVQT